MPPGAPTRRPFAVSIELCECYGDSTDARTEIRQHRGEGLVRDVNMRDAVRHTPAATSARAPVTWRTA